jgi:hypothetical protein
MATNPQPPRPPAPPQPPAGSNLVVIALLLVAIIVVAGCLATWIGLRVLSRAVHVNVGTHGKQQDLSIQTPLGSLQVNHELNEASLGLPIYPGSTLLTGNDAATVNIDIGDQAKVRVLAGKFQTPDSVEKVTNFYHERLGNQVTKFRDKDEEGKTVFEIKHGHQTRVVTLKSTGNGTAIELVRVSEGQPEAN